MIERRSALLLLGALAAACRGSRSPLAPAPPPEPALALDPLADLASGAGLVWLVQARPRDLLTSAVLTEAVATVVPANRFDAFAGRHGGVDLRLAREVVVCGYPEATLALARVDVEPSRVERAFAERVEVDGRADDGGVRRAWGTVGTERTQVAIFGSEAVGLERGRLGPLLPAIYFAQGKLRRSLPALRAEPLASLAALVGEAPLRGFAPGPFEGAWAQGFGGLLRGATAVGGALRGAAQDWALRLVVAGAWAADAPAAALRLGASVHLIAEDPLCRLMGIGPMRTSAAPGALQVDIPLDPVALARGLSAATGADVRGIMTF